MTDYENPVWGQGETELYHGVEAPAADYPFYPTAACGQVIIGPRVGKADLPSGADLCATCEKSIFGQSTEQKAAEKSTPAAPEKKEPSNG